MNQATHNYISQHISDDVRKLALVGAPADVDLREALQQIEGRQLAISKLPTCAATEGFGFPPRLSLEQCSSEATASYKHQVASRLISSDQKLNVLDSTSSFCDLTGGLGIDFMALASLFQRAVYVERNSDLCSLAHHNFPLMGCPHAEIICEEVIPGSPIFNLHYSFILIDPVRRDSMGHKVALIEDCTPDVCSLQQLLRNMADIVLIKLSPMLDLSAALHSLRNVVEAHIVSVEGECKELLLVMKGGCSAEDTAINQIPIYCVDLKQKATTFCFTLHEEKITNTESFFHLPDSGGEKEDTIFLYEPNASILKAGAFKTICHRFPLHKLAPNTHLYASSQLLEHFPGRIWRVIDFSTFAKKELKKALAGIKAANLTVRGFPISVASLRKQLHLNEGGSTNFVATTLADNSKILFKVQRISN